MQANCHALTACYSLYSLIPKVLNPRGYQILTKLTEGVYKLPLVLPGISRLDYLLD